MSNKLTFEEWLNSYSGCDCNEECLGQAWNFCQAQEQKEISELKKKVEELVNTVSSQTEIIYKLENECSFDYKCPVNSNLQKENESLKKKLEKAEEVIKFYGDKTNWIGYHREVDTIIDDVEWSFAESDGFKISLGGKRARAYLKENV